MAGNVSSGVGALQIRASMERSRTAVCHMTCGSRPKRVTFSAEQVVESNDYGITLHVGTDEQMKMLNIL